MTEEYKDNATTMAADTPKGNCAPESPEFLTPPAQVVKKRQKTGLEAAGSGTVDGVQEARKLGEAELVVLKEIEKACLNLAAVEVALRRCSCRTDLKYYKNLSQQKRTLLDKARKLRRQMCSFSGSSTALAQQIQYVDFALSVTTTVPGLNDLEDDQLRKIFTEVLQQSDNCPTSMMSLSRVCKRWGKLVRSADVWRALHLNKLAHSVADHELLVLLGSDKALSKVSSISLPSCVQVTEKSLLPILRCCGANLTYLDVSGCWLLTKRVLEVIVECCPKLMHLNMSRCSGIMLEDTLDIISGTPLANNLQRLGIAYMGGVCHRISRSSFEVIAEKTESFLMKHPNVSVGSTQLFFRMCMRKLEDIPLNTDQTMCQAPFCSLGDGDDAMSQLQLLQCGHVICLGCESMARGNVRTVLQHRQLRTRGESVRMSDFDENLAENASSSEQECYVYPCPTCGHDMGPPSPCSKSFSILL
ncbi:hypothetical protein A3770_03p20690 [Chloropicon primus]|uniref:F-box domain-containing protein n=1 Tax=Chloropicon primus TaxID=1764295 RepID=A0A5B8MGU2_9CHLO|nr:hypothetical protein A3770_03p20690 [Chloropicon primus]|eukprot:QDZ19551.1 hypothetical protein A3770_03p20690 [Chloropicon primus]